MKTLKSGPFEFHAGYHPLDPARSTILFIHGASLSKGIWSCQIDSLSDTFNTVALDLPGHGGSDGPGRDSVKDYGECVLDFIKKTDIPSHNLILCGMSMGGAIVQQILIEHPDACKAAILINTGARLKVLPMIFESVTADFDGFIRSAPDFSLSPSTDKSLFEDRIFAFSSTCSAKTAYDDFTACNGFDVMDRIETIGHPVLVFSAGHDLSTPPKYGEWLAHHIKNAQHVHVPEAGHYSPLEKADIINEEIRRFIKERVSS